MKKLILKQELYASLLESVIREHKMNPDDLELTYLRGLLYNVTQQYSAAIEDLKKVLQIEPENITAYFLKSDSHFNMGEMTLAKEEFTRALFLQNNERLNSVQIEANYIPEEMAKILESEKAKAIEVFLKDGKLNDD